MMGLLTTDTLGALRPPLWGGEGWIGPTFVSPTVRPCWKASYAPVRPHC